jgi:hypothetical protein
MSAINLTALTNGILFDLSARVGAGTTNAKYVFRPSHFHTITKIEFWNNRMSYTTVEGTDFNFSYDGTDFSKLQIDGADATDNYDLFNKFIAKLD